METILTFSPFGLFVLLLGVEVIRPARTQPRVRGWRWIGFAALLLNFAVALYAPLLWSDLLARHQLFDASWLGTIGGAIVGLLVLDLATFAWHYLLHHVHFLWRWFHQVHHSAEPIDTAGAFYFSPLDMLGFTAIGSLALVWFVGVTAEAAMIAGAISTGLAMFQHANVRTPTWLGYIVQRPEAHNLHHGRDVHALNYGNLAIWDLAFGTWRNPDVWEGKTGLYDGSTKDIGAALLGRDIHAEHAARVAVYDEISFDSRPTMPSLTRLPATAITYTGHSRAYRDFE